MCRLSKDAIGDVIVRYLDPINVDDYLIANIPASEYDYLIANIPASE